MDGQATGALERWREQLDGWAIPEEILAAAPESPWEFPVGLFRSRARRAGSRPATPSNLEAARFLPEGEFRLVCEKSTVPVQTGERVAQVIAREARPGADWEVASNPEFLREGSAVVDTLAPDRVVVGTTSEVLTTDMRHRIHAAWSLDPINFYGTTEAAGDIRARCRGSGSSRFSERSARGRIKSCRAARRFWYSSIWLRSARLIVYLSGSVSKETHQPSYCLSSSCAFLM